MNSTSDCFTSHERLAEQFIALANRVAAGEGVSRVLGASLELAAEATGVEELVAVMQSFDASRALGVTACLHGAGKRCDVEPQTIEELARRALKTTEVVAEGAWAAFRWGDDARVPGAWVFPSKALGPAFGKDAFGWLRTLGSQLWSAWRQEAADFAGQRWESEIAFLNDVVNDCATLPLERLLDTVSGRICRAFDAALCALWVIDESAEDLSLEVTSAPRVGLPPTLAPRLVPKGPIARALAEATPVRLGTEALGLDSLTRFARATHAHDAFLMPFIVAGRVEGVSVVLRETPLADQEVHRLLVACRHVASAFASARQVQVANERAKELEVVQSVAEALGGSLESETLSGHALSQLCTALRASAGAVYLLKGRNFRSLYAEGLSSEQRERALKASADEPLIAAGLAAGRAIDRRVARIEEPTRTLLADIELERVAVAPLRIVRPGEPDATGVVVVGRKDDRRFTPGELRVLSAVTAQLAVALQNASLFEETQRRMEEMALVVDASAALARSDVDRDALDEVARRLARLAGVEACSIFVVDEEKRLLEGRGTSAPRTVDIETVVVPLDADSISARAARERVPADGTSLQSDPYLKNIALTRPAFATAVPLLSANATVAVLVLSDERPSRRLRPESLARLGTLGTQIAMALERARLVHALESSIAELAHAQRELVRQERLAALGEMAALVAHEIRNPLGAIFNSLAALGRLVPFEGDARSAFHIMREEADRLDRIVGDMLDYTRPLRPTVVPASLDRLVRDAVESARASERRRGTPVDALTVEVHVDPTVPLVRVDERLMHQAVVNVVSNAMQSVAPGGHIDIRLLGHGQGDARIARIEVADDGAGFPMENRERLFEPFATTKAAGSGLGLAVVRRVMDAHAGDVSVVDRAGGGTVFRLDVPAADLPPPRAET